MRTYSRVYAAVSLSAIRHNMEQLYRSLRPETGMVAVVKADAYGHGAVEVARTLETEPHVWGFAVATADEGEELRTAGIKKPILLLGTTFPDQCEQVVSADIRPTIYKRSMAEALSREAVRQHKILPVHIKIDTGMNRIGYRPSAEAADEIAAICQLPGLAAEGIFTHFVKADEPDKSFSQEQLRKFREFVAVLEQRGLIFPLKHCAGSAGIIDLKGGDMDLVRAGISLYGMYPSEQVNKRKVQLTPALELISQVAWVKDIAPGDTVSYGATFQAGHKMRIATIPVGYGDGYPRSLSNKGYVLIRGARARILGRICMDQFMVDVTDIPGVTDGDRVVLIGRDGKEALPVEVAADISERFNYEFVCCLGKRIPRIYKQ